MSWNPGSTLATNLVATELFKSAIATTAPRVFGTSGNSDTIDFDAHFGFFGLSGIVDDVNSNFGEGVLNGTPWSDVVDDADKVVTFYFQGDLIIPDNSTVVIQGDYVVNIVVGNNVVIGKNVTIDASAGAAGGGAGGTGGSSVSGSSGSAGGEGGTGGTGGGIGIGNNDGGPGGPGIRGVSGTNGQGGTIGTSGGAGVNSAVTATPGGGGEAVPGGQPSS